MRKTLTGKIMIGLAGMVLSAMVFINTPIISLAYTQATGIISTDAAKVRKEPSTESDVVTGLLKGSTVTVIDEVTDSAGSKWYKVNVDGSTGYVRSDLMIKGTTSAGNTTTTDTTTSTTTSSAGTTTLQPTQATKIAETKAYASYDGNAIVREGASTKHEIAGSVTKNTPVTITGEVKAGDGKWYEIKYNNANGNEVVGFVRADLITVGEAPAAEEAPAQTDTAAEQPDAENLEAEGDGAVVPEPEPAPEPEPVPETKPDYEMVFRENNEGISEWYIFNNIEGTMETYSGLKGAVEAGITKVAADKELISTQKIIIIVLAAVAAVLVIIMTILIFKIKDLKADAYDDEDDDEDEEDEEEEEDEDDEEEEDEPAPRRVTKPVKRSKAPIRQMPVSKQAPEPDPEPVKQQASRQAPKKAKNFLIDDDEFEFEFLNMDDKE